LQIRVFKMILEFA